MKTKIIIGGVLLLVIALMGGVYLVCFRQTVCVVNSRIKFLDRRYKIDRKKVMEFVKQAQPEKELKTVYLWQKAEKAGFNKKELTANKPLVVEIKAGTEGKVLSKKGAEEVRVAVLGEDHKFYNRLVLNVNIKYEDIYDAEIGGTIARALRWYVGSREWPHEEDYRLVSRL